MLNNAEGVSSSFNSESSCCFPPPLFLSPSPLSCFFYLSLPPLAAVFSTTLNPLPGSVSMVMVGSKALAGQSQPDLKTVSVKLLLICFYFSWKPCVVREACAQTIMALFCLCKCAFVYTCPFVWYIH